MYRTKIKERYIDRFSSFWKADSPDDDYLVVMSMGNMSLLYCEETGLLLDIYNNKIEHYKHVQTPKIMVEAKNMDYRDRFDLHGVYQVVGYSDGQGPPPWLVLQDEYGNRKEMLPSRLRVVEVSDE
jgi:hypothetical protein